MHALLAAFILFSASVALDISAGFSEPRLTCYTPPETSSHIFNTSGTPLKFLITGSPRNGAGFITKLFELNGFRIRPQASVAQHVQYDGIVSWAMASDVEEGPKYEDFTFERVLHQVRHPLHMISDILQGGKSLWGQICHLVPDIKDCHNYQRSVENFSALERAASFWYYWNLLAERRSSLTYTVEGLVYGRAARDIEGALGLPAGRLDVEKAKHVPRQPVLTSRRDAKHKLSWWDVYLCVSREVFEKVVCLADRYGYDVSHARALLNSSTPVEEARQGVWMQDITDDPSLITPRAHRIVPHLWVRLCCQGLANNRHLCTD